MTQNEARKSIKQMLIITDPFKTSECYNNKCKDYTITPKLNCKTKGVVYKMKCQRYINDEEKRELYIGETAWSLKERINDHINNIKIMTEKINIWFSTNIL